MARKVLRDSKAACSSWPWTDFPSLSHPPPDMIIQFSVFLHLFQNKIKSSAFLEAFCLKSKHNHSIHIILFL
jgi:hypothetical protein